MASLENISIEITTNSTDASNAIRSLNTALTELSNTLKGAGKFSSALGRGLKNTVDAASKMDDSTVFKLNELARAMREFGGLDKVTIKHSFSKNLSLIADALKKISAERIANLHRLSQAMTGFSSSPKLSKSFVSNLQSLGDALKNLSIGGLLKVKPLASAMKALAGVGKINISPNIGSAIQGLNDAIYKFDGASIERLRMLIQVLKDFPKGLSISKTFPEKLDATAKAAANITDEAIDKMARFSEACANMKGIDFRGVGAAMRATSKKKSNANESELPSGSERSDNGSSAEKANSKISPLKNFFTGLKSTITSTRVSLRDFFNVFIGMATKSIGIASGLGKTIGLALSAVINSYLNTLKQVLSVLKQIGQESIKTFGNIGKTILGSMSKAMSIFPKIASEAASAFAKVSKAVGSALLSATKFVAKNVWESSPIKKFSNSLTGVVNKLKTLYSSLARIAMYRVLRTLFKNISSDISDAVQQLYNFDKGLGGDFSKNMDLITQSMQNLKASLGTLAANIINILSPAINSVLRLITALVDGLSQLFAVLGGNVFYKAKDSAATYADTLQSGSKAAKEWKNQLLGFDEINKLTDSSSGSGGSGKSSIPIDYEKIKELPDWLKRIQALLAEGKWLGAGHALAAHLNGILDGWDATAWGKMIGAKIQHGLEFALGFFMNRQLFITAGKKLAQAINGIVSEVKGETLGTLMAEKLNALSYAVGAFIDEFDEVSFSMELSNMMTSWVNKIKYEKIRSNFKNGLGKVFNGVKIFIENFSLAESINKFANTISGCMTDAAELISSSDIVNAVIGWVGDIDFVGNTTTIVNGLTSIASAIDTAVDWDDLSVKLGTGAGKLSNAIIKAVNWKSLGYSLSNKFNAAMNLASTFIEEFDVEGMMTSIADMLTTVVEGVNYEKVRSTFKDGIGKVFLGVKAFIENYSLADSIDIFANMISGCLSDAAQSMTDIDIIGAVVGWVDEVDWAGNALKIGQGIGELGDAFVDGLEPARLRRTALAAFRSALNLVAGFIEKFSLKDAIDTFSKSARGLLESVGNSLTEQDEDGKTIADKIVQWIDDVDWATATANISAGVVNVLDAIKDTLSNEDNKAKIKDAMKEIFMSIDWGTIMSDVAKIAAEIWKIKMSARFAMIESWAEGIGRSAAGGVGQYYSEVESSMENGFMDIIQLAYNAGNISDSIFEQIVNDIAGEYNWSKMTLDEQVEFFRGKGNLIGNIVEELISDYKKSTESAEEAGTTFSVLGASMSMASDDINNMASAAENLQDSVDSMTTEGYDNAIASDQELRNLMPATAQLIQDTIVKSIGEAVENFKTSFTDMGNAVTEFADGAIKTLDDFKLSAMNTSKYFIDQANSIISSISTMKTEWATGWEAPSIPMPSFTFSGTTTFSAGGAYEASLNWIKLAKGGIVDGATPFVAGEAGKEAVIPLERNTGWISQVAEQMSNEGGNNDDVINALYTVSGQLINAINNKDSNAYIDGKKITDEIIKRQRQTSRAMGV